MRPVLVALAVLASPLAPAGPRLALAAEEAAAPAAAPRLQVVFKLDPRLSGPTYGGERWVSPRTWSGAAAQDAVEMRALAVDARGRSRRISAEWASSDPERVEVSAPRGEQVRLTVKHPGESRVTVRHGGVTRTLTVTAQRTNGVWIMSIAQ